jgi:TRAP-type C4-dicarboxylate transport system permease small subunit
MTDKVLGAIHGVLALFRTTAAILLVASVLLNFANIIGRYFFSISISWAEEIMLFLMVGCVFLGAPQVAWTNRHIRMDVVVGMMPLKVRRVLELLSDLAFIVVSVMIAVFAWPVIQDLAAFDERSQAANFPLVIPQALVPFGLAVMALLVAIRLLMRGRHARAGAPHA